MKSSKSKLSPAAVAKKFGVSPITVRSWVAKGLLKASVTPGGHRRFNPADVDKLIQQHSVNPHNPLLSKRILVVDDDRQFRGFLVDFLSGITPKIEVAEAADGFAAGLMLAEFRPDIILLDYAMPGLSGAAVCRMIRSNPQYATSRIIAITGHAISGIEQEMLQAGADTVLIKPVTTAQLYNLLDQE
jgi:excisionase family DNA binding protein